MNILVIDNDRLLNWAISYGLQKENHTVFNCFNNSEAKSILENQTVDLIIFELIITERKGLAQLPIINKLILSNIPIIIVSEYLADTQIIHDSQLNCIAIFSKPVDAQRIIDEVTQFNNTPK